MRAAAILLALLLVPAAQALRVVPEQPVAGQRVAILTDSPGSSPEVDLVFLRDFALPALVGTAHGPHLHAPRVGGNLLHVPSPGPAPQVEALHDGGGRAWIGAPEARATGWVVPLSLPAPGAWALTVDGAHLAFELPPQPSLAAVTAGAGQEVLIAVESPLRPDPPTSTFILHVARRAGGGEWLPLMGEVGAAFTGNATVAAQRLAPGRYSATLPTPSSNTPGFLRVNASGEGAQGSASFSFVPAPPSHEPVVRRGNGSLEAVFLVPGPFLVLAHDWQAGLHAAKRVEVIPSGATATPAFSTTVPLVLEATFSLRGADGRLVEDPGPVQIGLAGALGNATSDGRGNVTAQISFPSTGSHRIRLLAPHLGIDKVFGVEVVTGSGSGDQGGHQGVHGDEETGWWRDIPAPAALAALALALLAGRRRR